MSTLKTINVIHPSGTTNNLVSDNLGNVTVGNNLAVAGAATVTSTVSAPTVLGGNTASSTLTLQSTSGVGTTDSILFKVGSSGATTAMTISTSGQVTANSFVSSNIYGGTGVSSTLTLQSTSGAGSSDAIQLKVGNAGATTAVNVATTGIVSFPTTGAVVVPTGTTVQQPTGQTGMLRFNTTSNSFEGYNGSAWGSIGGGGSSSSISNGTSNVNIPSANGSITATTAGTLAMTIDTSQNVGIGTSSPAVALDVYRNATSTYGSIRLWSGASASFAPRVILKNDIAGSVREYQMINGASAGNFDIYDATAAATRMSIDSSGNVGIGTSSPNWRLQLNVTPASTANYLQITNGSTGTAAGDGMLVGVDSSNDAIVWMQEAASLKFATSNAERMRIDTSGNVGIGTSSPSVKLDVNGTMRSKTSTGGVINMDSTTTSTTNTIGSYSNAGAAFADLNYSAAQHIWLGNGNERMRIDSSGNVNIATSGVSAKLYVSGNSASNIAALTDGTTITPDFSAGNNFSVTLGGNRTLANPTNMTVGQSGIIYLTQDGTGSRTLAYGGYWKFPSGTAPTLTTTASATDALAYTVRTSTSITVTAILNIG